MNPYGMAAGELPDEVVDRVYDAAEVFKNFSSDSRPRMAVSRDRGGQGREFVVEVKRHRRFERDPR